jgi:hypothetical protein
VAFYLYRNTYAQIKDILAGTDRRVLEDVILNDHYNDWIRDHADKGSDDNKHDFGGGKTIPYIGWFWRAVDFASRRASIGDCDGFIGFMENNKWDYSERLLTDDEMLRVLAYLDEAIAISNRGGDVAKTADDTYAKLRELWDYMQTLKV